MARSARQLRLLEIINKTNIETQTDLADALREEGFDVTQATVSRDIKELGLIKVMTPQKTYKYAQPASKENQSSGRLLNLFRESVINIDSAQNIVVVKTLSGTANSACSLIDKMNLSEIIGSVAGDDTIILIVKDEKYVEAIVDKLNSLMI
ncbi:MAG TPA: arginine repressor [Candidatus Faecicola pullistercoris]|nr:arginine repressor [Candidatus Faecicola pullistercoris]